MLAQAPDDSEHRLGRPGGLLPGPDRLDRRHRLACPGPPSCSSWSSSSGPHHTPGRWRCATAKTTRASTCRCCPSWPAAERVGQARSCIYTWAHRRDVAGCSGRSRTPGWVYPDRGSGRARRRLPVSRRTGLWSRTRRHRGPRRDPADEPLPRRRTSTWPCCSSLSPWTPSCVELGPTQRGWGSTANAIRASPAASKPAPSMCSATSNTGRSSQYCTQPRTP
jgi:hypothetical protein